MVTDGLPELDGGTLREMEADLAANHAGLARMLVGEPRGHAPWHAALPLPAFHPEADLSILVLSALGSLTMCGHAPIGTVTCLVEMARIEPVEPVTRVAVETLSGLVVADARVEGAKVRSVTFQGVPSWVALTGLDVEVDGHPVEVDIAFGGLWFALVRIEQTGMAMAVESVPGLIALSHRIRLEVNRALREGKGIGLRGHRTAWSSCSTSDHPVAVAPTGRTWPPPPDWDSTVPPAGPEAAPAWPGTTRRGELGVGDTFVHESVLNTMFSGTVKAETEISGRRAIIPHHHRFRLHNGLQPVGARRARPPGGRDIHPRRRRNLGRPNLTPVEGYSF